MSISQPLVVDVAWATGLPTDPFQTEGSPPDHAVAAAILRELMGDPDGKDRSRTGVPVFFRRLPTGRGVPPPTPDWTQAERRAVVVLLDDELVAQYPIRESASWAWIEQVLQEAAARGWLVLPIALTPDAMQLGTVSGSINLARLAEFDGADQARFAASIVALEVHRLLSPDRKVSVFISYASADGQQIADGLKRFFDEEPHLAPFLDRTGIYAGEDFGRVLDENVTKGPVIAVVTDAYAASVWCGQEILEAKAARQPVVVIDAIEKGHERSFPYLGNGPVTRWHADQPHVTYRSVEMLAIRETLRRTYLPLRVEHMCRMAGVPNVGIVLPRAPELMTLVGIGGSGNQTVVYPDPPIPTAELKLLEQAFPRYSFRTPTEVLQ